MKQVQNIRHALVLYVVEKFSDLSLVRIARNEFVVGTTYTRTDSVGLRIDGAIFKSEKEAREYFEWRKEGITSYFERFKD